MDLERALTAARAALDTIEREGRWAYADGHWPLGQRTGPAGIPSLFAVRPSSPDDVAGAERDPGIGAYRAREAYRLALRHVAWSDDAVGVLLAVYGVTPQPRLARRPVPVTASELPRLVACLRWRLAELEVRYVTGDPFIRRLTREVLEGHRGHRRNAVLRRLDDAAVELSGAMQAGVRDPVGTVVAMCRYGCGRPAAARKGGKCDACHQADYRGSGSQARTGARADRLELRRTHARHRAEGHGYGHD